MDDPDNQGSRIRGYKELTWLSGLLGPVGTFFREGGTAAGPMGLTDTRLAMRKSRPGED
jgi:hypothetical protein